MDQEFVFPTTNFAILEKAGDNLEEFLALANWVIPLEVVCAILRHLLLAVSHLQKHDVVHRNIKPDNIVLGADGNWKLIGFLAAGQFHANTKSGLMALETPYQSGGESRGSASLAMAPEIYHAQVGSKLSYAKADNWAIGNILYRIAGMTSPFESDTLRRMKNYDVEQLPLLPEHLAPLQPVLHGLLAVQPAKRWSVDEALKALERVTQLTRASTATTRSVDSPVSRSEQPGTASPVSRRSEATPSPRSINSKMTGDRKRSIDIAADEIISALTSQSHPLDRGFQAEMDSLVDAYNNPGQDSDAVFKEQLVDRLVERLEQLEPCFAHSTVRHTDGSESKIYCGIPRKEHPDNQHSRRIDWPGAYVGPVAAMTPKPPQPITTTVTPIRTTTSTSTTPTLRKELARKSLASGSSSEGTSAPGTPSSPSPAALPPVTAQSIAAALKVPPCDTASAEIAASVSAACPDPDLLQAAPLLRVQPSVFAVQQAPQGFTLPIRMMWPSLDGVEGVRRCDSSVVAPSAPSVLWDAAAFGVNQILCTASAADIESQFNKLIGAAIVTGNFVGGCILLRRKYGVQTVPIGTAQQQFVATLRSCVQQCFQSPPIQQCTLTTSTVNQGAVNSAPASPQGTDDFLDDWIDDIDGSDGDDDHERGAPSNDPTGHYPPETTLDEAFFARATRQCPAVDQWGLMQLELDELFQVHATTLRGELIFWKLVRSVPVDGTRRIGWACADYCLTQNRRPVAIGPYSQQDLLSCLPLAVPVLDLQQFLRNVYPNMLDQVQDIRLPRAGPATPEAPAEVPVERMQISNVVLARDLLMCFAVHVSEGLAFSHPAACNLIVLNCGSSIDITQQPPDCPCFVLYNGYGGGGFLSIEEIMQRVVIGAPRNGRIKWAGCAVGKQTDCISAWYHSDGLAAAHQRVAVWTMLDQEYLIESDNGIWRTVLALRPPIALIAFTPRTR
eukprot:TRINITY_DN4240_c0_g1_i2.p1 TRINITY_DN4240_c0_g1~~TRINITY_DN4240_c0_g1_i2.p1  ORF type:complete len:1069 (-),score=157.45 TRINITY_DN4240_c0_g1_i2:159-3023(-)